MCRGAPGRTSEKTSKQKRHFRRSESPGKGQGCWKCMVSGSHPETMGTQRLNHKLERPGTEDGFWDILCKGKSRTLREGGEVGFVLHKDDSIASGQYGLERGGAECKGLGGRSPLRVCSNILQCHHSTNTSVITLCAADTRLDGQTERRQPGKCRSPVLVRTADTEQQAQLSTA